MNYPTSTHCSRWIFTAEELAAARKEHNEASILSRNEQQTQQDEATANEKRKKREPLTVEEEQQLLKYYISRISHICTGLRLPRRVQAAAQLYLRRFYLLHSCLDIDPQPIALVCIYIACKIEENYISADELARQLQVKASDVLSCELKVLCGLKFDFIIHNPYRALAGFFLDIEALREKDPSQLDHPLAQCRPEVWKRVKDSAYTNADALMAMDIPLMFPPGQVAAQALRSACRSVKPPLQVDRYMRRVAGMGRVAGSQGRLSEEAAFAKLLEDCRAIDKAAMAEPKALEPAALTALDRKLKLWIKAGSETAGQADKADREERERRRLSKVARRRAEQQAAQELLLGPMRDIKRS